MDAHEDQIVRIWNCVGDGAESVKIIQDAIQQRRDKCLYAALGKHIDYNLRIAYCNIVNGGRVKLPDYQLVDYLRWEDENKAVYGDIKSIERLLIYAKSKGVPLANGLKVKIDHFAHFQHPLHLCVDDIRRQLDDFTLLASFRIHRDYSPTGETPYMGRDVQQYRNKIPETHAVVLVGEYKDDSLFIQGEQIEPLWIYQNSDGHKQKSFLGNGLNVVRHSLLEEVWCAETYSTSLLLHDYFLPKVKSYRI